MQISDYIPPIPHNILDSPRDTSQFHLAGPITFRRGSKMVLSGKSKKNPFINFGGNRQNQDSKARQIRMADKGYKLVNRDLSGADALVVALLCRQGPYRELFQYDVKPHTYLALHFFPDILKATYPTPEHINIACRTPIKELNNLEFWKALAKHIKNSDYNEPAKRYYYFGKKTGHSANYGQKPQQLIDIIFEETEGQIDISLQEGARWQFIYHTKFPEIQSQFQFGVVNYAKRFKCLRNLFGWPYNFHKDVDKFSNKDLNELYAWIPQSTVAAITLIAMVEFQDYIMQHDKQWHILNEVHDSILCECPENEVEECATILGNFMRKELTSPSDGYKFKIKSETKVGFNYGDYDKDNNPEGMQEVKI